MCEEVSSYLLHICVSAASVGGVSARSAEEANSVDVHEYVINARTVKQVNYVSLHECAVPTKRVVEAVWSWLKDCKDCGGAISGHHKAL